MAEKSNENYSMTVIGIRIVIIDGLLDVGYLF